MLRRGVVLAGLTCALAGCQFAVGALGVSGPDAGHRTDLLGADLSGNDAAVDSSSADPCGTLASPDPNAAPAACVIGVPPLVDGNLADWPPASFVTPNLSHTTAGAWQSGTWTGAQMADDADCSAQFAVSWDLSYLYVAVAAFDNIRGNPPTTTDYMVDALEIYVDGQNDHTQAYQSDDHHFIIRTDGTGHDYDQTGQPTGNLPSAMKVAVGTGDGVRADWSLEVAIPWSLLGGAPAIGRVVGFDVLIDDNDNPIRAGVTHFLIWRVTTPICDCWTPAQACYPACSTKGFASLQLAGR